MVLYTHHGCCSLPNLIVLRKLYLTFHQKLIVHSPPENFMGFHTESPDRITQGMYVYMIHVTGHNDDVLSH